MKKGYFILGWVIGWFIGCLIQASQSHKDLSWWVVQIIVLITIVVIFWIIELIFKRIKK